MSSTATPPKRPPVFNLPNQLTAGRLLLGVVLFVLIEFDQWLWCGVVFALAAVSDWLDGYIARTQNITSALGRNLDPLVDKVVICGAYIFLLEQQDRPSGLAPWMVVIVVSRELIITSLRSFMENMGADFGAEWLGKIKMVLQCGALFAIFLALYEQNQPLFVWIRDIFIWGMLAATALSGLQYLWRAFVLFKKDNP